MSTNKNCKRCHTCFYRLTPTLVGVGYCNKCDIYKYYLSHGYLASDGDPSPCPPPEEIARVQINKIAKKA